MNERDICAKMNERDICAKMNERKVGETFRYEGVVVKVKKQTTCDGCYFYDKKCFNDVTREFLGFCTKEKRADGNSIIFEEVKP